MGTNLTFATVLDTTADASPTIESISFKCEGIAASTFQTTALAADVFSITALYSENSEFNPVTSFARTDTVTMVGPAKVIASTPKNRCGRDFERRSQ
jgi:hypothetical protein